MSQNLLKLSLASRVKRSLLPESLQLTWVHACSVAKSCPTLCDPMDCSPPGSSVHGIYQARILEWVAISSPKGSPQPRDWTSPMAPTLAGGFFYHWATWEAPLLNWHQVSLPWPKSKPDKNFYVIKINVQKCFVEMSCYRTEFCSSPWVYPHSQFFSRRLVETSGKVIPESAEFSYLGHFVNGNGEGLGYWNQSDYCNDLDNEPNNGSATLCSLYFITQKVQILISCASLNYGEN